MSKDRLSPSEVTKTLLHSFEIRRATPKSLVLGFTPAGPRPESKSAKAKRNASIETTKAG